MKLQAASKKEISRIAVGTLVCDVIMVAGLFLLSQFGIGKFALPRILLGAACGREGRMIAAVCDAGFASRLQMLMTEAE